MLESSSVPIVSGPCPDNHKAMAPEARSECAPIWEREYPLSVSLARIGSAPVGMQNMGRLYMYLRLYKADGRCQRYALRHNGADASGRRAGGAEVGVHRLLVDDVALLSILLARTGSAS
jgi:hypothetical protein